MPPAAVLSPAANQAGINWGQAHGLKCQLPSPCGPGPPSQRPPDGADCGHGCWPPCPPPAPAHYSSQWNKCKWEAPLACPGSGTATQPWGAQTRGHILVTTGPGALGKAPARDSHIRGQGGLTAYSGTGNRGTRGCHQHSTQVEQGDKFGMVEDTRPRHGYQGPLRTPALTLKPHFPPERCEVGVAPRL